jgi:hypothetical protein
VCVTLFGQSKWPEKKNDGDTRTETVDTVVPD